MSFDDNHRRAHMTPMARNICTRTVFTTSSFNCGLSNLFWFTLLLQKGIICCFLGAVYAAMV